MRLIRKAAVATAAMWAGRKLYRRRQRRRAPEQPVPTGGDGYQAEPPTPRD